MWVFRPPFSVNFLWHILHSKGFSPVWVLMWILSLCGLWYDILHPLNVHLYFYSLSWVTRCCLSCLSLANDLWQILHLLPSECCLFEWFSRSVADVNTLAHFVWGQTNLFFAFDFAWLLFFFSMATPLRWWAEIRTYLFALFWPSRIGCSTDKSQGL